MGWRYEFVEQSWADVREFEASVWSGKAAGQYLLAIIDSVLASGRAGDLAVITSMHDLVIVNRPVPDPPMDVLIVRAPGSLEPPEDGCVRIDYVAVSGRNTTLERPSAEAVALFWRFVEEKFGITPVVR